MLALSMVIITVQKFQIQRKYTNKCLVTLLTVYIIFIILERSPKSTPGGLPLRISFRPLNIHIVNVLGFSGKSPKT